MNKFWNLKWYWKVLIALFVIYTLYEIEWTLDTIVAFAVFFSFASWWNGIEQAKLINEKIYQIDRNIKLLKEDILNK